MHIATWIVLAPSFAAKLLGLVPYKSSHPFCLPLPPGVSP
jgi:hypothetical protein